MFKKVNTIVLAIILLVLIAVYFAVKYFDSSDRSFRDTVLVLDPGEINGFVIKDVNSDETVRINKEGDRWMVVKEDGKYPADSNAVKNIMNQLGNLKTKRYAGKGEKAWDKYELTDTTALIVEFLSGGNIESQLYIGKFSYTMPDEAQQQQQMMMGRQQPQGEMTTYVRLGDESEVYAVDGFLRMNFNRGADSFRDKTITALNKADITRVIMDYPGKSMQLEQMQGDWLLNGQPCDSTKAAKYMGTIAMLRGNDFVEKNDVGSAVSHKITIEGNNFQPLEVTATPVSDTNIMYAISSSHNPTAFFEGKKSKLFEKVFIEETDLVSE
jgi:hypothetical protein